MRALLLHVNKFQTNIVEESSRPAGISPEIKKSPMEEMLDCLVCFFTVEQQDSLDTIERFFQEILRTAQDLSIKNIMISPFVHLSNNIATPKKAKEYYEQLLNKFEQTNFFVNSSHFGFHKSLLLDVKGHPGSFRYREF